MAHIAETKTGTRIADTLGSWLLRLFGNGPEVWKGIDNLGTLSPDEVDLIARDLGISPTALREAARGNPANTVLLHRMLEALNIDIAELSANHSQCRQEESQGRQSRPVPGDLTGHWQDHSRDDQSRPAGLPQHASRLTMLRDMQRLCGLCGNPDRCSHDLNTGRARETYGAYCLNAATLDELRAERQKADEAGKT